MRIIITGTPGTGKTAIAEILGRKIKHKALNEKDFCGKKRIGKIDKKTIAKKIWIDIFNH